MHTKNTLVYTRKPASNPKDTRKYASNPKDRNIQHLDQETQTNRAYHKMKGSTVSFTKKFTSA